MRKINTPLKICDACNVPFARRPRESSKVFFAQARFCTFSCRAKWQQENIKGSDNPNWKGGKKLTCVKCFSELSTPYALGKTRNTLYCRKCWPLSIKQENHHNWKGGITIERVKTWHSKEYKKWREAIFQKDNYTCRWCKNNQGGNLNADHIKPWAWFPELRYDQSNGQTLCETCHDWKTKMDNKLYRGQLPELNIV